MLKFDLQKNRTMNSLNTTAGERQLKICRLSNISQSVGQFRERR